MKPDEHLTHELLVGALDDELPVEETAAAQQHLSECEACQREYGALRTLSVRLGAVVASVKGGAPEGSRESLAAALEPQEQAPAAGGRPLRAVLWGVAIAAGLVLAAIWIPWTIGRHTASPAVVQAANGSIDLDGESFLLLPYSNPDLPISASHIVEMQVPIASLADAGVSVEPVSAAGSGSVFADILIGLDGQPLGIHVLRTQ
ncbi:MAG TPA: zf-HC2 domain-containing protein [Bryobacteraceae bacterium]